jgi:hypothetical protein
MTVIGSMLKVKQSSYQVTNAVFVTSVLDSYSVAAMVTSESSWMREQKWGSMVAVP